MIGKKAERKLLAKVRDTLARPDWALHFPDYCALPSVQYEEDAYYEQDLGKDQWDRPCFWIDDDSLVSEETRALFLDDDVAKEEAYEALDAWEEGSLKALEYAMDGHLLGALPRPGSGLKGLVAHPRAKVLYLEYMPFINPRTLNTQVLLPLKQELAHSEWAIVASGPESPWDEAARVVTRLVELSATARRLTWRLPYFQFSIENLELAYCELGSDGLVELGRYARENRNLLTLQVSDRVVDVSMWQETEARRRS